MRLSPRSFRALLLLSAAVGCASTLNAQPLVAPTEALTPAEQHKKFHLPPGFEIQLVTSEPNVQKPMNLSFDDRGRLVVSQSVEYPYPAKAGVEPRDTVRVYSDLGPDGHARRVSVLVDKLNIPIGVMPTTNGALVYQIPNIYRATDADGDGRAEKRDVLYGTFEARDTHGMANSFTPWIDGWVYACHGFANTSNVKGADGKPVTMNSGNTYRFRADGSHVEQYTWGQVNPFGMCFDPLGNVYTADCHSMPVYMLLRGAYYPSFGKPHDGLGYGPQMLNHSHGSTGIAGVAYYAADHFPKEYRKTIFIGNPVTGRVNHDRFDVRGSTHWAVEQPDFISCDDLWFRPVDVKVGPDGALYIADFYNCIIGHYEVPLTHPRRDRFRGRIWRVVYKGIKGDAPPPRPMPDLAKASAKELTQLLGDANLAVRVKATNQLVERIGRDAVEPVKTLVASRETGSSALQRAHGLWVLERWGALDDALANRLAADADRLVRVHLMRALSERRPWTAEIAALVRGRLMDDDAYVRRAAADALGQHPAADNVEPLLAAWAKAPAADSHLIHVTRIALRDTLRGSDAYDRLPASLTADAASMARLADVSQGVRDARSASFILAYVKAHLKSLDAAKLDEFLYYVARTIDAAQLPDVFAVVAGLGDVDLAERAVALRTLNRASRERGAAPPAEARKSAEALVQTLLADGHEPRLQQGIALAQEMRLTGAYDALVRMADGSRANAPQYANQRAGAIDACAAIDGVRSVGVLAALLGRTGEPTALRQRAASALGAIDHESARAELLKHLAVAPRQVAAPIAAGLAARRSGGEALLAAIRDGKASAELLREPTVIDRLRQARIPKLNETVAALTKGLPPGNDRIAKLIAARRDGFAKATPDPTAGKIVFHKHCGACHRLEGEGTKIGPDLDGIGVRGLDRLLEDVLDPNGNVDQSLRATAIRTTDGQIINGLVLRTEGQVLVVADSLGKEVRVDIDEIEQKTVSNLSPMPANVAELVSEADFYHLMAYLLKQSQAPTAPVGGVKGAGFGVQGSGLPGNGLPAPRAVVGVASPVKNAAAGTKTPDFDEAARTLRDAIADRAFPGCSVAVGTGDNVLWTAGFGHLDYDGGADVTSKTLYDLASLTKVVGTTSVVMALVRDGKIKVADPLEKHLPQFAKDADNDAQRGQRRRVTIEHLLTHSSGLPAWRALYRDGDTYDKVLAAAARTGLEAEPGQRFVYSDVGYILLGEAAARAGGKPLAELEQSLVFKPLGMNDTLRTPPATLLDRIAPTERKPASGSSLTSTFLRGVVHDENARAGQGLTGHAGLFSKAQDVAVLAGELLRALRGGSKVFPQPLARTFVARREMVKDSSRALGWDTPSSRSSAGSLMSRRSFGHTGFTGTSLWIDPDRDLYVVLLTNRVHPTRENQKIAAIRRNLADAVVRAVDR